MGLLREQAGRGREQEPARRVHAGSIFGMVAAVGEVFSKLVTYVPFLPTCCCLSYSYVLFIFTVSYLLLHCRFCYAYYPGFVSYLPVSRSLRE